MAENKRTIISMIFTMILLFTANILFAGDTGKIAGIVVDKTTGEPLAGANIIVNAIWVNDKEVPLSNPTGASSGVEGDYFILNLRPGFYTVRLL
jgi:hypothetical protein